jgi:hypothetical protein
MAMSPVLGVMESNGGAASTRRGGMGEAMRQA